MTRVEVNNLSLMYNRIVALKDISFTLEDGKVYGLLGRNGAGKTSLLSLLASFRQPSKGTVKIDGEVPFENAAIMQKVAFIYGKDYTTEDEKVKGLLEFTARYRPNYDAEYARYLVNRFQLPLDKPVNKLSKGMQSALNVTIGLAARTPITIFDEAYLGMDAPTREIFYQELLEEQARHPRLMIISTHLVSEMDYLFDEVLIIHRGKLLLHLPYEELISRGATITGEASAVERFTGGMKVLNEQRLGNTKAVTVYGQLREQQIEQARLLGLDIGPVSLQDLFIYLTGEDE